MGAHMYLRIGELCREWNLECNAAQLDVRKAFDHVCHAAALRAMEEMGVGNHSRALIAKAWSLSKVRARLANKTSEPVNLERGLPQGAPESPIIFAMILERVVRRCEEKWAVKGWGFWLNGKRWVSASYSDDIFLISAKKRDLEAMIKDITSELEAVGLGLGANKTHWSSYPAKPGEVLHVGSEQIQWEQVLVFVGMVLDLSGSSWAAVGNRLNQGAVSMRKWSPTFRSKSVNGKTMLNLMVTSVWASVLWGSVLWTLTKAMKSAIDSWSARTVSTMLGIKRGAEEAMDQWWRRFHRVGHEILKKRNQSLSNMAERLIHRWAGHVARLPTNHWLAEVVSSTVLALGAPAPHRQVDRCSPRRDSKYSGGKISCANGTAMDARRTRGIILDGGRTPKTACLGVVLSSEHSTGHGFSICSNRCECGLFERKVLPNSRPRIGDSVRSQKKRESESESESETRLWWCQRCVLLLCCVLLSVLFCAESHKPAARRLLPSLRE